MYEEYKVLCDDNIDIDFMFDEHKLLYNQKNDIILFLYVLFCILFFQFVAIIVPFNILHPKIIIATNSCIDFYSEHNQKDFVLWNVPFACNCIKQREISVHYLTMKESEKFKSTKLYPKNKTINCDYDEY